MRSNNRLVVGVENAAARNGFALDTAQRALLERLAVLGADLDRSSLRRSPPRSLYIHGDAGRGKSWLADAFYAELPLAKKTRVHFHGFFDDLHRSIHDRRSERDAVERAIDDITQNTRLLFFDELHVHDSGDARLLTRLLDHVFQRGLIVLATSNYAPDDLLPNPIWHHIFEPGIALIKKHMDVWNLAGPVDYRTVNEEHDHGFAAGTWTTTPARSGAPEQQTRTVVNGRSFAVTSVADGELVATFEQLCSAATSTVEYLDWARSFSRWVITDIPSFSAVDAEAQQRFINLVDVLADAEIAVRFSSRVDLSGFLADASERPDAFRMASRLQPLRTTTRSSC
ncbi:cell division protein ZapE [Microbacterium sp. BWT-B31]|uniref:cell division protein ZapE n=1 Tax=Microbacterium sp. BWT-B31 TaxID=3232072 RepID=UPI0035284D5E